MKSHKFINLLVVLALVACGPTLGPSTSITTSAPRPVAALATVSATPAVMDTVTVLSPVPPSSTPAATTATLLPTPTPLPTDAPLPLWGNRTKTAGCVVLCPFPDPACTPGDIFPDVTAAQVWVSGYSSSVRDVPASEKDAVYAEYGVKSHMTGQYEVDHFVSLELGGSNDISNLFPEAASPTPGFHEKDRGENFMHDQVCKGVLTLAEAQSEIAANWLVVYMAISGGSMPPAATATHIRITFTPAPVQGTATQAQHAVPTATEQAGAAATVTLASPAQNCDRSYPDVCIPPPPPDLNCKDIPYRKFKVLPLDPHHFDADHDGIGCET